MSLYPVRQRENSSSEGPSISPEKQNSDMRNAACGFILFSLVIAAVNAVGLTYGHISTVALAGTTIGMITPYMFTLLGDVVKGTKNRSLVEMVYKVILLLVIVGVVAFNGYAIANAEAISPTLLTSINIGLAAVTIFEFCRARPTKKQPQKMPDPERVSKSAPEPGTKAYEISVFKQTIFTYSTTGQTISQFIYSSFDKNVISAQELIDAVQENFERTHNFEITDRTIITITRKP